MLRILQEAAAIASDDCGYGMKDVPRTGVCWLLSSWRVELLARPAWRSHLTVRTWPRSLDGFLSDRDFLVYYGEALAAKATSRWLLMNAATGRIARITEKIRGAYALDSRALYDTPVPSNGRTPAGTPAAFSTVAGRRDIDTNHHVNNAQYVELAREVLPEEIRVKELRAEYKKAAVLGDKVCPRVTADGGSYTVALCSEKGSPYAVIWMRTAG